MYNTHRNGKKSGMLPLDGAVSLQQRTWKTLSSIIFQIPINFL